MREIDEIFTPAQQEKVVSKALHTHDVIKGQLVDTGNKLWIRKEITQPELAKQEALAQEFFRLIIPHQPETRLAQDSHNGKYYVLSEEVLDYQPLPRQRQERFDKGRFSGLGQAIACALFLQEVDLKNGNIGLNGDNQVIKIDGDWCFASLRCPDKPFAITDRCINDPLKPHDFYAYHWLDWVKGGKKSQTSNLVSATFHTNPLFRGEFNQAMLRICCLPDTYLEAINASYFPATNQEFFVLLRLRRDKLIDVLLRNPSFMDYLHSSEAMTNLTEFKSHLHTFCTNNQTLTIDPAELNEQVDALYTMFVECISQRNHYNQRKLTIHLSRLIEQIKRAMVDEHDDLLKSYIKTMEQTIMTDIQTNNMTELKEIRTELEKTLASVSSPEVLAIKEEIKSLRKHSSSLKQQKAEEISYALKQTHPLERSTVLSDKTLNPVQIALAKHSSYWKSTPNPSNKDFEKKASKTFKALTAQFRQIKPQQNDPEVDSPTTDQP